MSQKERITEIKGGCCGYDTPFGRLVIEDDGEGITAIHFEGQAPDLHRPSELTDRAAAELAEYFAGSRREFSLALRPNGTEFQRGAWAALLRIPYGETRSYRQVAELLGRPNACRAVGMANHRNPIPFLIPCHRVVGADGSLTGYAGGLEMKRRLLALEHGKNGKDEARMKCLILQGSPRREGNTASLVVPFADELRSLGVDCTIVRLYEKQILPCVACRGCQSDWASFGCVQKDDMHGLAGQVLDCDLLVLATPIYSWYCTPPVKAALDRLVYGLNKYYGEQKGSSLWAGKRMALITTCGYRPEQGADLWEAGMRRYCKHSGLRYQGMLAERHLGYGTVFFDGGKERRAREFARLLRGEDCAVAKG